jgi:hypothetical protein
LTHTHLSQFSLEFLLLPLRLGCSVLRQSELRVLLDKLLIQLRNPSLHFVRNFVVLLLEIAQASLCLLQLLAMAAAFPMCVLAENIDTSEINTMHTTGHCLAVEGFVLHSLPSAS